MDNLNSALTTWNDKLAELWTLISTSPESFKGGGVWTVIQNINGALQAVGYGMLVLFFAAGVVKTCGSFAELKKPEMAFRCFVRFVLAQAAIGHGMELMMALFNIAQGMVSTIMSSSGLTAVSATALPSEMVTTIESVGFIDSIPLWAITLLGSLFIWVLSLVMILTVYSRFFKLYMATAIAPIPLASFCETALQQHWRGLSEKLRRHLPGGLCDCTGLCNFLSLCLVAARHHGQHSGAGYHCVELHRRTDL